MNIDADQLTRGEHWPQLFTYASNTSCGMPMLLRLTSSAGVFVTLLWRYCRIVRWRSRIGRNGCDSMNWTNPRMKLLQMSSFTIQPDSSLIGSYQIELWVVTPLFHEVHDKEQQSRCHVSFRVSVNHYHISNLLIELCTMLILNQYFLCVESRRKANINGYFIVSPSTFLLWLLRFVTARYRKGNQMMVDSREKCSLIDLTNNEMSPLHILWCILSVSPFRITVSRSESFHPTRTYAIHQGDYL